MAPETMWPGTDVKRKCSKKSDVWMFGCVLFEIFNRKIPYYWKRDHNEVATQVATGRLKLFLPDHILPIADLMKKCQSFTAKQRPSFEIICGELNNINASEIPPIEPAKDQAKQ